MKTFLAAFLAASVLLAAGCISNRNHPHTARLLIPEEIQADSSMPALVSEVLIRRGWSVIQLEPGHAKASITRKMFTGTEAGDPDSLFTAVIDIAWEHDTMTITHAGGTELSSEKKHLRIGRYNHWLRLLSEDLARRFNGKVLTRS